MKFLKTLMLLASQIQKGEAYNYKYCPSWNENYLLQLSGDPNQDSTTLETEPKATREECVDWVNM